MITAVFMKTRIAPNRLLGLALLVSAVAGGSARGQTQTPLSSAAGAEARTPSAPELSHGLADFLRLARTGVDESGLLSCVSTTTGIFDLRADQIIYLQKVGISSRVIIAMLQHDAEALSGRRPAVPLTSAESQGPAAPTTFANQNAVGMGSKQTNNVPAPWPARVSSGQVNSSTIPDRDAAPTIAHDISSPLAMESQALDWIEPGTPADLDEAQQEEEPELYPVRKPYPVKLSDPIIVFRAPMLTPNLVVIQPLP